MLRDPVEQTKEYMDAMKIISKEMDDCLSGCPLPVVRHLSKGVWRRWESAGEPPRK